VRTNLTGCVGTDGSGTEMPNPPTANSLCAGGVSGSARAGIFATVTAGRQDAGASYWGIMELSGNLWERPVTVGATHGRSFVGTYGSGVLNASGNATNADWYAADTSAAGFRGGGFNNVNGCMRVSDRSHAANHTPVNRDQYYGGGGRGVRTAPSGTVP